MLGGIAGDIIGSVYEAAPIKTVQFPLLTPESTFTDDTVLAVATAEVLLCNSDYAQTYRRYWRRHPGRGYGRYFRLWASDPSSQPYFSLGNGSAMRVGPVGWARESIDSVLAEAQRSAAVSHNHPEGIRGAQAVALAVFLARQGVGKDRLRAELSTRFGYALSQRLEQIRPHYRFDATCPGSVPQAVIAFLEADDFEQAVRNAVSLGGDSDTQACISGYIAEAHFGMPQALQEEILARLTDDLRKVVLAFRNRYGPRPGVTDGDQEEEP